MDPRPTDDLAQAVQQASEHLGVSSAVPEDPRLPDPPHRDWGTLPWLAVGLLTALLLWGAVAILYPRDATPDPASLEADLRWSVAQVVEEVERLRGSEGELPDPQRLGVLLSEAVTYARTGGGYTVTGARGGVEVVYDGAIPLETWRQLQLYGPGG